MAWPEEGFIQLHKTAVTHDVPIVATHAAQKKVD